MKTYQIQFNDNESSDSYGVEFTNKAKAIEEAKRILSLRLSYTDDYIGGTIEVYNETDSEVVWEKAIN